MWKLRILSVALTFCVISAIFSGSITNAASSDADLTDISIISENKIYSTATIDDHFTDDKVMVILTNAASLASQEYNISSFSEINCKNVNNYSQNTADVVKTILSEEALSVSHSANSGKTNSITASSVDLSNFYQYLCLELAEPSKENVLAAIKTLEQREDILYAGPNYIYTMPDASVSAAYENSDSSYISLAPYALTDTATNDTYAGAQWAISQIDLDDAWNICTGSNTVTVGILDTGIDANHPDLLGKVNKDASRDCVSGYALEVDNVTDQNGHGTMVAGIIGATANNGAGICGTNWNIRLVSLRITDIYGNSHIDSLMSAFNYAHDNGIKILNLSFSYLTSDPSIAHFITNTYQGLLVCAAGNNSGDIDGTHLYPACHNVDRIISVGASNMFENIWTKSNYGKNCVDLFAPGESIISCYTLDPVYFKETNKYITCNDESTCSHEDLYHHAIGYHGGHGTSLAAPYVAGVAALIMAEYPNLNAEAVKDRILDAVDLSSAYFGKCVTNGRLNAYKALHNHSFTSPQDPKDSNFHYSLCSCGVLGLVDHSFTDIGGIIACADCGYVA